MNRTVALCLGIVFLAGMPLACGPDQDGSRLSGQTEGQNAEEKWPYSEIGGRWVYYVEITQVQVDEPADYLEGETNLIPVFHYQQNDEAVKATPLPRKARFWTLDGTTRYRVKGEKVYIPRNYADHGKATMTLQLLDHDDYMELYTHKQKIVTTDIEIPTSDKWFKEKNSFSANYDLDGAEITLKVHRVDVFEEKGVTTAEGLKELDLLENEKNMSHYKMWEAFAEEN